MGRDGPAVDEPALCMICGKLLNSGSKLARNTLPIPPGDCTIHAEACGNGVCVFLLINKGCPLIIHAGLACFLSPLYLDNNGEIQASEFHSKPLYLSNKLLENLEEMYLKHELIRELYRVRSTSDKIIRRNWY